LNPGAIYHAINRGNHRLLNTNHHLAKFCDRSLITLLVVFASVYVYAMIANPMYAKPMKSIALPGSIRVTVTRHYGGSIIVFNEDLPYLENISYIDIGNKAIDKHFGVYGFWYLSFQRTPASDTWWTIRLNPLYPILLCAILIVVRQIRIRRDAPRVRG
jgi:hypothetical protein